MMRFPQSNRWMNLALAGCLWMTAALPGAAEAATTAQWDDEPNELSWQHLATSHRSFDLWANWFDKQDASSRQQILQAAQQGGLQAGTPVATSTRLWIQAEAFGEQQVWKPAVHAGRRVLRGPAGHNASPARLIVNVPQAGMYRLWTRWFNYSAQHSSLSVRVRPTEAQRLTHRWLVPDQPDWLAHRVGFVPFKRKTQAHVNYDVSQRGWLWDGSPWFKLPAGKVVIEIAGMVHQGPYASRMVDLFLLTTDPLDQPGEDALPDSQANDDASLEIRQEEVASSDDQARQWLWAIRPGVRPIQDTPAALAIAWQAFRHELIQRLAEDGEDLSLYEKHLGQLHYFDERWNLVGTPAQVAGRVAELHSPANRVTGFFQWIEGEDFTLEAGWEALGDVNGSLGRTLQASYSNGRAKASSVVNVPGDGSYRLWVRYARIRGYHNTFEVSVMREGQTLHEEKFHEIPPADAPGGGYQYVWHPIDVTLKAGSHEIVLTKHIGKPPYAYRKIDCVVLTDHTAWQPDGTSRPILPGSASRWFAWLGADDDHWTGFGPASRPLNDRQVITGPVAFQVQPGAVGQRVVHLTNDTDAPITLRPAFQGSLPADWRVAAGQYHPASGWQPMPLLRRHEVTLPAGLTTSLWVNIDARQASPGEHQVTLDLGQGQAVTWQVSVTGTDIRQAASPYVGGWMSPPHHPHGYEMMADIGLTILHGRVIPKAQMDRYGLRLSPVMIGKPASPEAVAEVVQTMRSRGLDYTDWAWIISDEPNGKTYEAWIEAAKVIRQADPQVRIWCNPGEIQSSKAEFVTAMSPYIDVFCPYVNHFGSKDADYQKLLATTGTPKLLYTTPCFREKSPAAPLEQLSLADLAIRHQRDGWDAFSLFSYYPYAASAWDEANAPFPDQAVSLYPGAHDAIIGSRNLEAVRQAVTVYKTHHAQSR